MASEIKGAQPGIDSAVSGIVQSIGGIRGAFLSLAGVGAAIGAIFKAGKFEQTTIAFETMIGSVQETKNILASLTEFAAKTPFEMPEILQAARGLIMFGERGDELIKTLNILGNAAAGTSTPFGFIALVFNQIRGVGKLLTQDFRQLSSRGVLSLKDIADYYGVTTEAAQKMMTKGRIGFEDVKKILESLSKEGGRFANLMERQSRSLLGLWSTLKDSISLTATTIGQELLPVAKDFVGVAIKVMESIRGWVGEHTHLTEVIIKSVGALVLLKGALMSLAIPAAVLTLLKTLGGLATIKAGASAIVNLAKIGGTATTVVSAGSMAAEVAMNKKIAASALDATMTTSEWYRWRREGYKISQKVVDGFIAEQKAMGAAKASLKGVTAAWGNYGDTAIQASGKAEGLVTSIGSMIVRFGLWAVIIGEVVYALKQLYDIWDSIKTLGEEKEKGKGLDVALTAAIRTHGAAYRQGELDRIKESMRILEWARVGYRGEKTEWRRSEASKEEEREASDIANRRSSYQKDVWMANRGEMKGVGLGQETEYVKQRTNRWAAEVNESMRKIWMGTRQVAEGWSNAQIKLQEFIDANPGAPPDWIRQMRIELEAAEFAVLQKSLEDMSLTLHGLQEDWDDVTISVEAWARANKDATEDQIEQYRAMQQGMKEAGKNKELRETAWELFGKQNKWDDVTTATEAFKRANKNATQEQVEMFRAQQHGLAIEDMKRSVDPIFESRQRMEMAIRAYKSGEISGEVLRRITKQEQGKFKKDWAFEGTVGAGDIGRTIQNALLKPQDKTVAELEELNAHQQELKLVMEQIRDKPVAGALTK